MRYTRISTYDVIKGDFNELTGIAERASCRCSSRSPAS